MSGFTEEIFESDYEDGFAGEGEFADMEAGDFESDMEWGFEGETGGTFAEGESPFSEEEEIEMAAELLSLSQEGELDQFLGNLIRRAGKAAGQFVRSPTGQALGGLLRQAAKRALPLAGRAVGTALGGPLGGAIGSRLASAGGRIFGLELEGMSPEDQELQVAQRFVRMAGDAASRAAATQRSAPPQQAARAALAAAARVHAPGLLRPTGGHIAGMPRTPGMPGRSRRMSGRWIRRGDRIVLFGA